MMRQLPRNITAVESPEWLPAGWIAQSTVLKSGREIRSYTHLKTGQKFSTKDDVLQYIASEKVSQRRTERAKRVTKRIQTPPRWLPDHWKLELRTGYTGHTYKVYTNLLTGYRCYNMRAVWRCLQYAEHENREQNQLMLITNERPEWLPKNWIMEVKTTESGGMYKVYIDQLSGCKCYSKTEVTRYLDTVKCEASTKTLEETGTGEDAIEEVNYEEPGRLPANSKMKLRTRKRGLTKEKQIELLSSSARRRKLKSSGTRQQLFVGKRREKPRALRELIGNNEAIACSDDIIVADEDTSSSGDSKAEASKDEIHDGVDCSEVEHVDVVVEHDDQTIETSGMTGLSGAEVNVECQGASTYVGTDSLSEKDLNESRAEEIDATNIELASTGLKNGKDGLLTSGSDSAEDEIIQETGCKSKEPLKMQGLLEEEPCQKEITNESGQLLFFPFKDASTDADKLIAFNSSTATLSAEVLSNTFELASKSWADNPLQKNTRSSKMQKKSIGTSLSKKIKENNPQIPCRSAERSEKPETPGKLRGKRSYKATSEKASAAVDQNEHQGRYGSVNEAHWSHDFACETPSRTGMPAGEGSSRNNRRSARQQMDHWPDLCPEFVFESLTSSPRKEDDSVIRRYFEECVAAAGTLDGNVPLPDFGLPSFAHIELSSV